MGKKVHDDFSDLGAEDVPDDFSDLGATDVEEQPKERGWKPLNDLLEAKNKFLDVGAETLANLFTSLPQKTIGAVDETLNNYVYNPIGIGAGKNYTSPLTKSGQWTQDQLTANVDPEFRNSLPGQIAQGLGTGVGMMATGGLGTAMRAGETIEAAPTLASTLKNAFVSPSAALGGAMTAIPEYEAAKAAGVPEDQLFGVLMKNYLVGQTEALPIQNMLGRLNKVTGGALYKRVINASTHGAIEEGLQEGIQTYLTNEIAKENYDPDRDPFWGIANAMTVGGIVGAILPGVGAAINTASANQRPKLEKKLAELQSFQKAVETANNALQDNEQIGDGIDEQIDQAAQLTEDQATTVQNNNIDQLATEQAEDRIKDDQKERKEVSSTEREGQTTKQTEPQQETGTEETPAGGVVQTSSEEVSPEYKAADEAYQAEVAKLRASPNIEITPNGVKPLNEAGIEEFKRMTEKWQARDNIRIAELKTPVKRGSASIKMTPGQALREQVQTFYRGVAKGVTKGSQLKSQLLTKVQEAIKEYPLSPKQVSTILTKVRNTNLFTPGSVSRLNDFIGKVADDATLAEKYDQAYALRKKIKGKRTAEGLSWPEKESLKSFTAIDPDYVDIDQYLGQANSINENLLRPVKERKALDLAAINDYNSKAPDTNAIKENEKAEKLADSLGLTFEEANLLLGDDETQTSEDKRNKAREQLLDIANEAKQGIGEDVTGATPKENEVVKALKKIDTNLLSDSQLKNYIRSIDRISNNGDFAGTGDFIDIARAQDNFAKLLKMSTDKNWHILDLNNFEGGIDSLPVAIQAITGLPEFAAAFQEYMGTKGIADASAASLDAESGMAEKINALRKKHKKAFENDSIIRQGIYGELIAYEEDTDPNQALQESKDRIQKSIEVHRANGEREEADKIANLYKPFENALTIEDVQRIMKDVDPDGLAVMNEAINEFKQYADDVVEYNNLYHNQPTKKIINYSGPRKWRKGGTGLEADEYISDLNLAGGVPQDFRLKRMGQTDSAKARTDFKSDNAVLDFNKHSNMLNGLRKTVFDTKAVGHVIQLVENSKRKELTQILGAKEGDDKAIKKANELKDKLFGKDGVVTDFLSSSANKKIPDKMERQVRQTMNLFRKFGYTLSLSGLSQIPKQATVLTNVALQLGGMPPIREAIANKEDLANLLKGETISLRGAQKSQFSLGEVVSEKETNNVYKGIDDFIQRGFEGWAGIKPLVATDVKVAQITWLGFYKQYLENHGIEYKGLKEENNLRDTEERRMARSYAKQRTDALQVTSNPHELGKWIKAQSTPAQLIKALLIPYGTFSTNSKARMWADWRAMKTGNAAQRKAAAKDLGASLVEAGTFNTVSAALKLYVWSLFGRALVSMFDLPEERDRKEKTWDSAVKVWKTNMIKDALPLILTAPGENIAIDGTNLAAEKLLGYDKKNLPLYRYKPREDDILAQASDFLGPYMVPIEKAVKQAQLTSEVATGEKKGREMTEEQKNFAIFLLAAHSAQMAGFFPADVINQIEKEYNKQKPGRRRPVQQ